METIVPTYITGKPPYFSIPEMLLMIPEPNGPGIRKLYWDNLSLFVKTPGSVNNHQAWIGGYHDHIMDMMNLGLLTYQVFASTGREMPFDLADVLLVDFDHDLEKPWKYQLNSEGKWEIVPELRSKRAQHAFKIAKLAEYDVILSDLQINAIKYAEGELDDYNPNYRVAKELAGLAHISDFASARVFPNYPLAKNDPWAPSKFVCRESNDI